MATWIDTSYDVHPGMRSHIGGCVTLGQGVIYYRSSKRKLNTKISTEAELIGESDYLPFPIWTQYFLNSQGYKIDTNDLNQDNMSAMKMERNRRASSGYSYRRINIRYFFIKNRINKANINII